MASASARWTRWRSSGAASAVDRRTHERMTEAHLRAEIDQSRGGRRRGRVRPDAELGGRPPHQHRIPSRLSRRDEKQEPRRGRERRQPLPEALLDPPRQRRAVGQPEPARELGGRPATWQLEQRQRVAARLGHDPITHPLIERTGDHRREQLVRIAVVQPAHGELRQALKMPLAARLAHGEDQPDRLRTETARDEGQRLRRGRVEPLRVVHDADERSVFRNVREQTQDRQADEEPIRRVAVAQTERGAKRIALRAGKALEAIQERRAQLLQPAYASSISDSTPAARAMPHPDACCARYSSNALLPTPASPRSTSARL